MWLPSEWGVPVLQTHQISSLPAVFSAGCEQHTPAHAVSRELFPLVSESELVLLKFDPLESLRSQYTDAPSWLSSMCPSFCSHSHQNTLLTVHTLPGSAPTETSHFPCSPPLPPPLLTLADFLWQPPREEKRGGEMMETWGSRHLRKCSQLHQTSNAYPPPHPPALGPVHFE